ncbi:MAG: hypothetical protein Q9163_000063 [Psora crenata]
MLAIQAISLAFLRKRLSPRKTGFLVEWSAYTELPYLLFSMAVSSQGGFVAFAVIYRLFSAGIQSPFPATLSSVATDLE